jgi:hypothetical protein
MRALLIITFVSAFAWPSAVPAAAVSALEAAVRSGDLAAAEAALAAGETPDFVSPPFNLSPLALSAARGDTDMVRLLLDAGADPDVPTHRGMTALSVAVRSCGAGPDVISALIAAGADLEDGSGAGLSPLMVAIQEERTEIALLLLAEGADVNTRNQYGDGVLNYAIYWRNPTLIEEAMDRGVDTGQLRLLFETRVYYYPGFGQARPQAALNCR